jgi:hypothetical protein
MPRRLSSKRAREEDDVVNSDSDGLTSDGEQPEADLVVLRAIHDKLTEKEQKVSFPTVKAYT